MKAPQDARDAEENTIPHYTTMVNATDGSELAWQASQHAVALAQATGAELIVVNVIDVGAAFRVGVYVTTAVQEMRQTGAEITGRVVTLAAENGVKARSILVEGKPGPTLVALLEDLHADLMVMGAKGITSLARLLLGSTSEHVLRHSPCPVLLVHRLT